MNAICAISIEQMKRYESSMLLVGRIKYRGASRVLRAIRLVSSPQVATSRAVAAEGRAVSHVFWACLGQQLVLNFIAL